MLSPSIIQLLMSIPINNKSNQIQLHEEQEKNTLQNENIKEYWTQHRTTLIAFEAQYIYAKKPNVIEQDEKDNKKSKGKKKDTQFDGGFLFPGREGDKETNVIQNIKQSNKYKNLKQLFDETLNQSQGMIQLRQFVKIMLELKHSCIIKEFLQIYEVTIREIKDIKFQQIKLQSDRFNIVTKISEKLADFVTSCPHNFKIFMTYIKDDKKQTIKLFKVTVYCFLAEKHNFNINEFYSDAFEFQQTDKKIPTKKRKADRQQHDM